jgi:transposase-like protein
MPYRDLEELLAERGVEISYETVMRSSHQTLRWRGMDSKIQFRDASPSGSVWAPSVDGE